LPDIRDISSDNVRKAAEILQSGGLVALPTETVYGLAANALDDAAVKRIYAAKGRPAHNPLIVHVFRPEDAAKWARINQMAQDLIAHFWPGPLTLVLPKSGNSVSKAAGAKLDSVAIRCPVTNWTQQMIDAGFMGPVVMPSANRSGHVSPTTAKHVADDLGDKVDLILDGGTCPNGIESTVLKIGVDHAVLLRPGAIPTEAFVSFISDLRLAETGSTISAPGMLKSHYAPNAKIRLNATDKNIGEAYLAFGETAIKADFNLSGTGNLEEAARNLYRALRMLDTVETIAVAPIPFRGLGEAINDRLNRAAAAKE